MPTHTNFSRKNMIPRSYHCALLALFSVFLLVPAAWGAGLWLYETGGPDLGTAGAGRAALAADASTAGSNPAGMTRLDRSQMLGAVQGLYVNSRFDTQPSGFGGGDGDIDQEGGPLNGPLKGDYDPNAIHFFAVNLIWKF
jgi:long-subunit fatty acid transport protein